MSNPQEWLADFRRRWQENIDRAERNASTPPWSGKIAEDCIYQANVMMRELLDKLAPLAQAVLIVTGKKT